MNYAFIGGGNMARALIAGMLQAGVASDQIIVSEPFAETRNALLRDFPIQVVESNRDAAAQGSIWILAIKPQMLSQVGTELAELSNQTKPLLISILAGITLDALKQKLPGTCAVRAMPNTPALLKAGITALCAGQDVSLPQRAQAEALLKVCGQTVWMESESLMDTVTATSGSGPAYFFLLMEAMIDAAQSQGMPAETARRLVIETAFGAALMARQSEESVAQLRARVTSPGGTTQAAVECFERLDFRRHVSQALEAARARGAELAAQFGKS